MNDLNFESLINQIKAYNPEEVEIITKSYNFAKQLHKGQVRQNEENYISHSLSVDCILSEMHADRIRYM